MRHLFKTEQWLPYTVEQVFALFCSPMHLPLLMPKGQRIKLEAVHLCPPPTAPEGSVRNVQAAGIDSSVVISFRPLPWLPLRQQWSSLITEFAWNSHFCDLQVTGPFAYWKHTHRLEEEERNGQTGTVVRDEVLYEFPTGPLGEVIHRIGGKKQIETIFQYRQQQAALLMPGLIPKLRF